MCALMFQWDHWRRQTLANFINLANFKIYKNIFIDCKMQKKIPRHI